MSPITVTAMGTNEVILFVDDLVNGLILAIERAKQKMK